PMPPKRVMIPLVMAVPGARRPARGECLLEGDRVAVSGQAGIDTVVGLEPGRQPLASARLAVHQVHRWATLDGPVPVRQLRLAGMGRKAADGVNACAHADVVAVDAYPFGPFYQAPAQRAVALVADDHHVGPGPGQV